MNRYGIYGFRGVIKLFYFFILTKLFFSKSRLVRYPIEIRGKKYIDFGMKLTTGVGCRIEAFPQSEEKEIISFGRNVEINDYVHIAGINSVVIEDNVLIASKVYISDILHGCYSGDGEQDSPASIPKERKLFSRNVIIRKNVWIGELVSVLPGVEIGEGSIIGANSVVSKSIPPNSIAVGNPAIVIKKYNFKIGKWEKYDNSIDSNI